MANKCIAVLRELTQALELPGMHDAHELRWAIDVACASSSALGRVREFGAVNSGHWIAPTSADFGNVGNTLHTGR